MKRNPRRIVCALCAAALAWCGWCALRGTWLRLSEASVPDEVAAWRAAARSIPPDAPVAVLARDAALDSVAR